MLFDVPTTIAVLIPLAVALVTGILSPWVVSRRQSSGRFDTKIIEESSDIRKELRDRIDTLEARLEVAQKGMNEALDEIRGLRTEIEKRDIIIEELRRQLATYLVDAGNQHRELEGRINSLEGEKS